MTGTRSTEADAICGATIGCWLGALVATIAVARAQPQPGSRARVRPMRARRYGLLFCLIPLAVLPAHAEDRPITGFQLKVSRVPDRTVPEQLVFESKDLALIGPARGGADDPSLAGATIEVFSERDGLAAPILVPPAASAAPALWKSPKPNDYVFTHPGAPAAPSAVRRLDLRSGVKLRLIANAAPFALDGETGATVVRVSLGSVRYCARFESSAVRTDKPGRFLAKGSTSETPADCSDEALGISGPILPSPTQTCPTLVNGSQTILGKVVKLWISPTATTQSGPLVFVWHGLNSTPDVAVNHLLPSAELQRILDMGGVVAAFEGDGSLVEFANYFPASDELLGCALEQFAIDTRRIHSIGFSAGGLQTTAMSQARSNYIASVVAYSGGFRSSVQNPDNRFPALVVHGGPTDIYILSFDQLSVAYHDEIVAAGHYAILCNHNGGHDVPAVFRTGLGVDFLLEHPFGRYRSPYAGDLPSSYPSYCSASD